MTVINELKKINEIIRHPCNIKLEIPYVVDNYSDVLQEWKNYRLNSQLPAIAGDENLKNIFDFHKITTDHIILYWSMNQSTCLLMCKIDNKYINMTAPMLLDTATHSFVATYT